MAVFAAFGSVIGGWGTVEKIVNAPLRPVENDMGVAVNEPITPIYLEKVTIETWGRSYPFERL